LTQKPERTIMTTIHFDTPCRTCPDDRARRRPAFAALLAALDGCRRRIATRRRLKDLDDRLLADIGLSRAEAEAEAGKPFWKE